MMAVPLTEDISKGAFPFETLELECLGGLQVGRWTYRSDTWEKLVGYMVYELMYPKYVIELIEWIGSLGRM